MSANMAYPVLFYSCGLLIYVVPIDNNNNSVYSTNNC